MTRTGRRWVAVLAVGLLAGAGSAEAALEPFQSFVGTFGYSADGIGILTSSGQIQASVPSGATVEAAYLYTATVFNNAAIPSVSLNGTSLSFVQRGGGNPVLNSFRADVTSIVKPVIDGGAGGVYNFNYVENALSGGLINGSALVVVYNLASLPVTTVGILDGFSAQAGDTYKIVFADPLHPATPGFFAEMALGISHSCCASFVDPLAQQRSNITVNGTLISGNAGNHDDGAEADGALLTMGGFDDPFSPSNPSYADDHERYNLASLVVDGDTEISVNTNNPSFDDDIFLSVFHVFGRAGINEPPAPPAGVPFPGTLLLLGSGLLGLGALGRRRR